MTRVRTRVWAAALATTLGAAALGSVGAPAQALSDPADPVLTPAGTIASKPWAGSSTNSGDIEGSAYVEANDSLWISDDNNDKIYEIDRASGALKNTILASAFQATGQLGVGTLAPASRTDDFESIAYDNETDVLYVFSGNCCGVAPFDPAVFRLTRAGATFAPESWQPLPEGEDANGAGYHPGDNKLYYGHGTKITPYDYTSNVVGTDITVAGVSNIAGLTFVDSTTMFLTATPSVTSDPTALKQVIRVQTSNWTKVARWTLNAAGVADARSVEIVGDTFYVLDGFDVIGSDPVTEHRIFKFTLGEGPNLVGGYTLDGFGGIHRFQVGTGPLPPATTGGGYWLGWDIARGLATHPNGNGGYLLDGFGGIHRFQNGGANPPAVGAGAPYWLGWDIARGIAVAPNGQGGYVVDGYGGIHAVGLGGNPKPPAALEGRYWLGQDMARGITISADGKGGYVVDKTGLLWRFKIGPSGVKPPRPTGVFTTTTKSVQGVALIDSGTGGFTVDGNGGIHRFAVGSNPAPPTTSGAASWPGWDIARDITTLPEP